MLPAAVLGDYLRFCIVHSKVAGEAHNSDLESATISQNCNDTRLVAESCSGLVLVLGPEDWEMLAWGWFGLGVARDGGDVGVIVRVLHRQL